MKQGCLYVTRMTAEVAKLWNNYSTFADDGFYLGRPERSASVSEQSVTNNSNVNNNNNSNINCTSPATDIPMQRRNTQQ